MDKDSKLRAALMNFNTKMEEMAEAYDAIAAVYEEHGNYGFAAFIRQCGSNFKSNKLEIPMD